MTLLIDADLLLYKTCAACQIEVAFGDGLRHLYIREDDIESAIDREVDNYLGLTGASDVLMCLSSHDNFRKKILEDYKGNRTAAKPIGYLWALEQLEKRYSVRSMPTLEADDVMGILATKGDIDDPIIASEDKDLRQIPGRLFNPRTEELRSIDVEEGDYYHLFQCLVGDRSDNYRGCPGVGEVKAGAILSDLGGSHSTPWDAVVAAYERAGLDESEALVQARVAKILRAEDYDFDKEEPILWEPK